MTARPLAALLALVPLPLLADQGLRNARLEERTAGGLEAALRDARAKEEPTWIAWSIPQEGRRSLCCHDWAHRAKSGCTLGEDHGFGSLEQAGDENAPAPLLYVLLKAAGGRVERVRVVSEDCAVDAGGRTVILVKGVRPKESLDVLSSLAAGGAGARDRLADSALMAIAYHGDPSADAVLAGFARPERPEEIRKKAAFWMGAARGRPGYEALARLVREDASDRFREHVVFALSISGEPAAVDTLLEVARRDRSTGVRGQALFWLGQKAGKKAAEGITRAIEDDPETEVKKKAVFALSQLPKDEGVPLLLQAARTNRNPLVRREAMFWLGQSQDPRALAFFEEVLAR